MLTVQGGLWLAVAGVTLCLAAGYLGRLHPAGDSFAVFRALGGIALVLLAGLGVLAGTPWLAVPALAVAVLTGGPLAQAYLVPGAPGAMTIYQKNMLYRNEDLAGLEADIRAVAPEVLTLQEVSDRNRALLGSLADVLPHQVFCAYENVGGVAIATRLAPVPGTELCAHGLAAVQVEGPEGRVWLVSVHLHWPWPFDQAAHLGRLLPVIEGLAGPVVIAGDFNMVRWTAALALVRAAGRVAAVGPVIGSYAGITPHLQLPIDQVMAPGGGSLEARPLLGSDHRGLLARVRL